MRGILSFIPADSIMDLMMLLAVQMIFSSFHPLRLIFAQGLLTACTLAALACGEPIPSRLQFCVMLLCASVVSGERRPVRVLEACACMYCCGAVPAAFALGGANVVLCGATGTCLLIWLMRRRVNMKYRWNVEILIEKDGICAEFPALIDTGNRLREHRSGLPVLIIEANAAPRLAGYIASLPKHEKQTLPYGVLGCTGEICCFRPDRVRIRLNGGQEYAAPPCFAAVFPGTIPGSVQALAPPEFTEVFHRSIRFTIGFPEGIRRISSWHFQA